MNKPVAKKNMADAQSGSVSPGLLLGGKRINAFLLRLDHGDGPAVDVKPHVIDKAVRRGFEVRAEIQVRGEDFLFRPVFADNIFPPTLRVRQKPPARRLQEFVN